MIPSDLEVQGQPTSDIASGVKQIVNDFSIQVATVNGSGSQSANAVLLRSIFHMGVPVTGKSLFPSNIAGLPTWFTIRVSKHGWTARKNDTDILISMNPERAQEDVLSLAPGAVVIFDEPLKLDELRSDVIVLLRALRPAGRRHRRGAEAAQAGAEHGVRGRGGAASLHRHGVAGEHGAQDVFPEGEGGGAEPERGARRLRVCQGHADQAGPVRRGADERQRRQDPDRRQLVAALGALFAGVTVVAWYPITPSTSTVEDLIDYMKQYRVEKDGKASFAIVQAEDELAAIGMVMGAGWAGARAMTATSGPGISLMAEIAGLGYYVEIPSVILDVQRTGPSTGLPTRTSQADLSFIAGLSHGDTKHVMLLPASVKECFELSIEAFDLAEQLQTPVFILSDLDLGMNHWMSEPFEYPEKPINRGKVLNAQQLEELGGFARYKDVDGDGIGYRTLPGTDHPAAAYFTRGSGHNEKALYSERPEDYANNMLRLARKFETAKTLVPKPILEGTGKQKAGIIAFGTSHWAVVESRDQLERESGLATDYLRIRAFPFTQEVAEFVASHERIYVVEQNRDAQMLDLLKTNLDPADAVKLHPVLHFNGLPIDARSVTNAIAAAEGAR